MDNDTPDALSAVRGMIALLKSTNIEVQNKALKDLMVPPSSLICKLFLEEGNVSMIIEMTASQNKRIYTSSLRLLWHLSAQAELKVMMYEEGILDKIKVMIEIHNDEADVQLSCAAILQNITEYRFQKGGVNPNQVKIVNQGALDCLAQYIHSSDKRVQFLTCLSVCNLSMNKENSNKIRKSNLLEGVQSFVEANQLHVDMVCHWITLQPHIPLLRSKYPQVQLFALSCLLTLIKNEKYKVEVWKALSVNKGVQALFKLCKSQTTNISDLSKMVLDLLQIEEPVITHEENTLRCNMKAMCNNPEFADVQFLCRDGAIFAHKAILASRCPPFYAMFTRFKESTQTHIEFLETEKSVFLSIMEYIYTGHTAIHRKNAVEVLVMAEYFSLTALKQKCEFFLWHYMDVDNVIGLYLTSSIHHAEQLHRVCEDFMVRNFHRIYCDESFKLLPTQIQSEILDIVGKKRDISNLLNRIEVQHNNHNNSICSIDSLSSSPSLHSLVENL